ncbi:hypothetical protein E1176_12490 [Fulvivirga sp. RKSG066]|uniref:hypothetical protein n=1 Tax=Fulvivirga aurantia TaxID=2529383 RepID=UPI0012BB9F1A|nr:hypothetical protein [Fulvivirga aurantia]MTI21842.1 hypothetical protein [Fulvivirga aurantia]
MRIVLKTTVEAQMETVFQAFDEKLFRYLLPPGAKLLRFDGSREGDLVHIKFGFPLFSEWISEIVEDGKEGRMRYFIDVGKKLPTPLKKWKHMHIVRRSGQQSIIEDNMSFSTGLKLLDILIYPFLYLAFLPRKKQYKEYFKARVT